ncbi:ATP-binding protein [Bradyrhizobium sp. AZCC 2230]|uniref:ATP-binding protein n=1 Tax=Bradyrhizobium sp. AZCC 2230 TaxID=3117021 RepID=UPI002FF37111
MNDHRHSFQDEVLSFGPFSLFVTGRQLKRVDEPVPLGGRAFDLLLALAERAGEVVSYDELISCAWPNVTVYDGNLRVQIAALRKALNDGEEGARYISNVAGRGYCFVAPVSHLTTRSTTAEENADAELSTKLPLPLARMVGRDEVVRAVSEQLIMGRFVSIVGPGGIGKTTVAISVAHLLLRGFRGAAVFIDLSALTNPQLVLATVGSALGFMVQAHDPFGSLVAFLGDRKILLILDNCEHVIDAASAFAGRLVNEAPQAHILATSREPLRVEGEHVHLLYSLEFPPADADLTAAEVLRYSAAQLFVERAAAAGHSTALSDVDAPIVAAICRRLDGIALAIELAASRAGSLGIRGIAELLDNRFSLLWHGRRSGLPRHQTMNAMLDWSYNLLPEQERAVLSRLSVFVGVFTVEAACSVAWEAGADEASSIEALESLVTKSLISTTRASEATCYRVLDTTRAYARAKLAERGEADSIARRHAEYYSKFLQRDEITRSRIGQHDFSLYAPHIGNVRAALEWALSDRGDPAFGTALVAQAAPLLSGLSLLEECRYFCERALAALEDNSIDARTEMILQEALALASMYTRGHDARARAALERGLVLAEALEDRPRELQLLASLNLFLVRQRDLRGARAAVERGRRVAQAISDPAGLVWAEWMTGVSHYMRGDQASAQVHIEKGMSLDAEVGSHHANNYFGSINRTGAIVALARVLWLRGFPDRALRTAQNAIDEMSGGRNHPVCVCTSLLYGASVIFWTGNFSRAWELVEQLIVYAERYALRPYRAAGVGLKGELQVASGEAQAGTESLREALEIMQAERYHVVRTAAMGALAEGLRKIGQFEEAFFTIDGAIASATHTGAEFDMPELLRVKAQILAARKERASARTCLRASIAKAQAQHALSLELRAAMALAVLLQEDGESVEARQCVAGVYDRFTEGFDTLDLKLAHAMISQDG